MISRSFQETCRNHARREAVIDGSRRFLYEDLEKLASELAARLYAEHSVRPRNRVVLHMPNGVEFIAAFFALMQLQATAVLVDTRWTLHEIRRALQSLPIQAVIASARLHSAWKMPGVDSGIPVLATEDLLSARQSCSISLPPEISHGGTDGTGKEAAVIFCTSGTMGIPKAVVRSHQSLIANASHVARALPFAAGNRILSVVPFHHANGFSNCMFMPVLQGGTLCVFHRFDVEEVSSLVAKEEIEVVVGSPFVFGCLSSVRPADWESVRIAISSGAPLPSETERNFRERLGLPIRQLYGSSETGTVAVQAAGGEQADGLVGEPLPGVQIAVLDPSLQPLPCGDIGEIAVSSPAVMSGYWESGGVSTTGFAGEYFRTGDLGSVDDRGRLLLRGRIKRMINTGGVKVDPDEIAAVIRQLPGVRECRTFGVPHTRQTEIIATTILVDSTETVTREIVVEHCRRYLAEFKIPRQVFVYTAAPESISGKEPPL